MSTTVSTPERDETCAYCGSRIFDHDPICVRDCADECGSPSYFCELRLSLGARRRDRSDRGERLWVVADGV